MGLARAPLIQFEPGSEATKLHAPTIRLVPLLFRLSAHSHCDWGWVRTPAEYYDFEVSAGLLSAVAGREQWGVG
jgi:hypothetical protein